VADRLCLLTVHAHPDDEASKGAGTVARYHGEGVRTVLVCCTGGEAGDILNPAMDTPEVRADLAAVRRRELERAARIIGYDEVVLLGYRDSGMPGTQANGHPDAFANVPLDEAVERLVAVVRRERPQVMVTYPEDQSGYPHPDHLRVHTIAVGAFDAAGDPDRFPDAGPPFTPSKLYYTVWARRRMLEMHERFLELGLDSPLDNERLARLQGDEPTTTAIDIRDHADVRSEALLAHATQVDPASPFWFGLPPEELRSIYPYDDYFLARSRVEEVAVPETDLFAGVR
jgi:mycothiol S-conjugate amidase